MADEKYCFTCGGNGLLDKVCPECGHQIRGHSLVLATPQDVEKFLKKTEKCAIPKQYSGVLWNRLLLEESHKPLLGEKYGIDGGQNDLQFIRFCNNLEKIDANFSQLGESTKSAVLLAPAGFSKMTFAYSCMQKALEHGKSVAPLLDTVELKRLIMLSGDNPNYKLYGKFNYDDYMTSDVCFVTVTKTSQRTFAFQVIQELLDKRARLGLTSIFLSRYSMNEITKFDESDAFTRYGVKREDVIKCPAIIKYMKGVVQ